METEQKQIDGPQPTGIALIITWKGKLVQDLTREEAIEAFLTAANQLDVQRQQLEDLSRLHSGMGQVLGRY